MTFFGSFSYPVSLRITCRYLAPTAQHRFSRFVNLFSTFGVMLGVAALITVLSVMNGFEQQLHTQILSQIPHARLHHPQNKTLEHWQQATARLKSLTSTLNVSPIITIQAVIQSNRDLHPVVLDGVDPDGYPVAYQIQRGLLRQLRAGDFSIILDQSYQQAGFMIGDQVRVIIPTQSHYTLVGRVPVQRVFRVIGFIDQRLAAYEQGAFIHRQDAARLLRISDDQVTEIRVWLQDPLRDLPALKTAYPATGEQQWSDWRLENRELFRAVHTEKMMTSIMLVLIIAVALFNILSAMIMHILSKKSDIAILRTLGMRPAQILTIFLCQGSAHGICGALLGVGLGSLLATYLNALLQVFQINFYFSVAGQALPILTNNTQIFIIATGAMFASVLAALYPACYAARIQPAEALKYE